MTASNGPRPVSAIRPRGLVRLGPLTVAIPPRVLLVALALGAAALASAVGSLFVGEVSLGPSEVLAALSGEGPRQNVFLLQSVRLPRALAGVVIGATLGLSGAVFQVLARNPLASPDVVGVQSGAAAGAVLVILSGTAAAGRVSTAAMTGGLIAAIIVGGVSRLRRAFGDQELVVGIGVAALFEAFVAYTLVRADTADLVRATVWLSGSLVNVEPATVRAGTVAIVLAAVPIVVLARSLGATALGVDLARVLGVRVGAVRATVGVGAVVAAAAATSVGGPIPFVALAAPHLGRLLARSPGTSLAVSAATGAALLALADLIVRLVAPTVALPVGLLTALTGAPLLFVLVLRRDTVR